MEIEYNKHYLFSTVNQTISNKQGMNDILVMLNYKIINYLINVFKIW